MSFIMQKSYSGYDRNNLESKKISQRNAYLPAAKNEDACVTCGHAQKALQLKYAANSKDEMDKVWLHMT